MLRVSVPKQRLTITTGDDGLRLEGLFDRGGVDRARSLYGRLQLNTGVPTDPTRVDVVGAAKTCLFHPGDVSLSGSDRLGVQTGIGKLDRRVRPTDAVDVVHARHSASRGDERAGGAA